MYLWRLKHLLPLIQEQQSCHFSRCPLVHFKASVWAPSCPAEVLTSARNTNLWPGHWQTDPPGTACLPSPLLSSTSWIFDVCTSTGRSFIAQVLSLTCCLSMVCIKPSDSFLFKKQKSTHGQCYSDGINHSHCYAPLTYNMKQFKTLHVYWKVWMQLKPQIYQGVRNLLTKFKGK